MTVSHVIRWLVLFARFDSGRAVAEVARARDAVGQSAAGAVRKVFLGGVQALVTAAGRVDVWRGDGQLPAGAVEVERDLAEGSGLTLRYRGVVQPEEGLFQTLRVAS